MRYLYAFAKAQRDSLVSMRMRIISHCNVESVKQTLRGSIAKMRTVIYTRVNLRLRSSKEDRDAQTRRIVSPCLEHRTSKAVIY